MQYVCRCKNNFYENFLNTNILCRYSYIFFLFICLHTYVRVISMYIHIDPLFQRNSEDTTTIRFKILGFCTQRRKQKKTRSQRTRYYPFGVLKPTDIWIDHWKGSILSCEEMSVRWDNRSRATYYLSPTHLPRSNRTFKWCWPLFYFSCSHKYDHSWLWAANEWVGW